MNLHPRTLFLIDGLGAMLSAIFLGVVLVKLEHYFGMPKNVLYGLASVACIFAVYSLTNHFCFPENWRFYLKGIATANFVYCLVTLSLAIYYSKALTSLGIFYFLAEVMVIIGLVMIEWKTAFTITSIKEKT